jgi:hypothetical protein
MPDLNLEVPIAYVYMSFILRSIFLAVNNINVVLQK